MAEITAAMVKELRERTGLGMMECKKALTAAGGDIEKAIDDMRAAGAIKAAKKAGNIAAEGSIAVKIAADNKAAVIIEVNSQTDFLALQDDFKGFVAESLEKAFNEKLTDAAPLVEAREEARLALVAKTGENVNIRRLTRVEGDVVGAYLHGHRIGVVVNLKGGNPELAKDIAMHVAASNPQFLSASEVSEEAIAKEKEIFLALNADKIAGKPGEHRREHGQGPHQQVPRRSEPGRAAFREEPGSEGRRPGQAGWRRNRFLRSLRSGRRHREGRSGLRCRSCRSSSRHQAVTKTVSTVAPEEAAR